MSRKYAAGTTVSAAKTEQEIKSMLADRKAQRIATLLDYGRFVLRFEFDGAAYQLTLPLPDPEDPRFTEYKQGMSTRRRTEGGAREQYDKEVDRRWRAFGAVIKAQLVAVEEGIFTMQEAFVGSALISTGRTVAEEFAPQIKALGASGRLPTLELPYRSEGR